MVLQDALVTLPHARYGEYLRIVYRAMAEQIETPGAVIEIGARHDRGVISREIIPHTSFVSIDRNPRRGDQTADVLLEPVRADVIISTCILHHTPRAWIPKLLDNLQAPLVMLSGPTVEALPELFGDHEWHIETDWLLREFAFRGYVADARPIGVSEPFSEVLVVARK